MATSKRSNKEPTIIRSGKTPEDVIRKRQGLRSSNAAGLHYKTKNRGGEKRSAIDESARGF